MANYKSKFNVGDTVWPVRRLTVRRRTEHTSSSNALECFTCDGTGTIKVKGDSFTCPRCRGRGSYGVRLVVSECGIVSQVGITDCPAGGPVMVDYIVEIPGVVSGDLFQEDELFISMKLAQEYCDRENGTLT